MFVVVRATSDRKSVNCRQRSFNGLMTPIPFHTEKRIYRYDCRQDKNRIQNQLVPGFLCVFHIFTSLIDPFSLLPFSANIENDQRDDTARISANVML